MPASDRAAQFAPFAALTGYGEVIKETARRTDAAPELTEDERERLDQKLRSLLNMPGGPPELLITYFVPDERKTGGEYRRTAGRIRRIEEADGDILMTDGIRIRKDFVVDIDKKP
ncbi:MAG TPA: hypothetical protein H9910_05700 [Candidatus Mediterraneibacter quadrami]|uniref:YolD-like family protein n=1 Tax=Candidatus Mediterraneibacter quadrami TaxID=2838684 RepID=A0A9D2U7U4_9FIRM|nr:hypothetical protein [Candidatus Mediterraneibacter quadrami]